MANILLVNPLDLYGRVYEVVPCISLGFIGTSLKQEGFEYEIWDLKRDKISPEEFEKKLKRKKFDMVGFYTPSPLLPSVDVYSKIVKKVHPESVVVIGGPHAILEPEDALRRVKSIDIVCIGEGEQTIVNLMRWLEGKMLLDDICNIAFRKNGEVVKRKREFIFELDKYPMPDWESLEPDKFPPAPVGLFSISRKVAPTIATRGCPFECTYCRAWVISGKTVRKRPVEQILCELETLKSKFGIEEVHFLDDNLTIDKHFILSLCKEIKKANLGLVFACPNGVYLKSLDREVIEAMEKAGFYSFSVGIESGNNRVLRKLMKRHVSVEQYKEKIELIKKYSKIRITGLFILGSPGLDGERGETDKDPGTFLWSQKESEIDFGALDNHTVVKSYCEVPTWRLRIYHSISHILFYIKPRVLFGILSEIKSIYQIKIIFYRMLRIFFGNLKILRKLF